MGGPGSTRWRSHAKARTVEACATRPADRCSVCGRAVRALYRPGPFDPWACRLCHGLTYASSQRSHEIDAAARDLSERIGMPVSPRELREAVGEEQMEAFWMSRRNRRR